MKEFKVFVVMANDFPDAVFDTKPAADQYCSHKSISAHDHTRKIYWRVYEFIINKGSQ